MSAAVGAHTTATRVYLALALLIIAAIGVGAAVGGSIRDRRSSDARAAKVLLGSTELGPGRLQRRAGVAEAFRLRALRSGSLRRLHVYLGSRTRAHELRVGLFAGGHGRPGRRLRTARLRRPRQGRWNAVRVRAVALASRRIYWVALLGIGGRLALRGHLHRSCTGAVGRRHMTRIPSRWRVRRHSHTCRVSLYGTGRRKVPTATAPAPPAPTPPVPAPTPPSPPAPPASAIVPCALTHAAGANGSTSCWATHTGVQGATGYTEAQIEAATAPGFTKVDGNVTVTTTGATIDHEWIVGCVSVDASDVTIEDSLITPPNGDYCEGGNGGTAASAINDGDGTTPTGLVVRSTTVDGGNANGNQFGVSIDQASCILCNVFGFAKNYSTGGGTAAQPAVFMGDYSHDLSLNSCAGFPGGCTTPAGGASAQCPHDNGFYMNSSDYVTIEDSYSILTGAGYCTTGAITNLADYGPPNNMSIVGDYMEGDQGADLYTGKAGSCGTPNIVVKDNAFSSQNGFNGTDMVDYWTPTGNTWSGNYVAETGRAVPEPAKQSGC